MGQKEMAGHGRHRHRPNNRRLAEQYDYVGEARLATTLRLTSYTASHVRSEAFSRINFPVKNCMPMRKRIGWRFADSRRRRSSRGL